MHPGAGRRVRTESRPRGFWLVGWPDSNPRLSPPALRQRNSASTYHDKYDDDGERFCHAQSLAAVIPKLKHALASIQSAPRTEKDITMSKGHDVESTCRCDQCYVWSRVV